MLSPLSPRTRRQYAGVGDAGSGRGAQNRRAGWRLPHGSGLDARLFRACAVNPPRRGSTVGGISGGAALALSPVSEPEIAAIECGVRGGGWPNLPASAGSVERSQTAAAHVSVHGAPRTEPQFVRGAPDRRGSGGAGCRTADGRRTLEL